MKVYKLNTKVFVKVDLFYIYIHILFLYLSFFERESEKKEDLKEASGKY